MVLKQRDNKMIIDKELKKLFDQLTHENTAQIDIAGSNITVSMFNHGSILSLATPIYYGGNYIPKSVRDCIKEKVPFDRGRIKTSLTVEEEKFQILLNYKGFVANLTHQKFIDLLDEFTWFAEEWRYFLDEHDKNDLVHIPLR